MRSGLSIFRAAVWGMLTMLAATSGCLVNEQPTEPLDTTSPAAVTDVIAIRATSKSVTLQWTVPRDKGTGTARYDVRYATWTITDANWSFSPQAEGEPKPKSAGSVDTFEVKGLLPSTNYHFALKSADAKRNWSRLSNVATAKTQAPPDSIPPSAVVDLVASNPTSHTVTLTWTAPGDDEHVGTAAQYDIRYSTSLITDASWASASQAAGAPKPRAPGGRETFIVTGLASNSTYYFALKTADETPNWSTLSNVASAATGSGASWSPLGSGMNSDVYALTVYKGQLIAGGRFTTAGGVTANHIAAWNGASWVPLGSGLNNNVQALAVYNDQLIAGGVFTIAGGNSANHIAAWNGSSWSPLGTGTNDYTGFGDIRSVEALCVYNGQLIAAGWFTAAGGVAANRIAAWDGTSWTMLGSGVSGGYRDLTVVFAFGVYNGQLIAGGNFTVAGGAAASYIAAWNGSSWAPLGSGTNYFIVRSFAVYDDQLIVGGGFTAAGGVPVNYIAAWNGSSWSALGSGTDNYVNTLYVYNNQLMAGGIFSAAGDVPASYMAAWNGSDWSPLGAGVGPAPAGVYTLTVWNSQLIVGGWFTTAGEVTANSIAAWGN